MLIEVCIQGKNKDHISDSSNRDSLERSAEYYLEDEDDSYTNSQYLRSDDNNSLVDHKNFKFDQSFLETKSSRDNSSNEGSDAEYQPR